MCSNCQASLDFGPFALDNSLMVIRGHVENGVVVLEAGSKLPEGAAVTVSYPVASLLKPAAEKKRIQVPLVPSDHPGSVMLTGEQIAEILDEEDAAPRH
jgi:hypothetical protein